MLSNATKESARITKDLAANDLKSAANDAGNQVNNAVDHLSDYANQAGRTVRHYIDNASDELSHVSDRVTSEIRTNPVRSTLIALAAGFVIGAIARR